MSSTSKNRRHSRSYRNPSPNTGLNTDMLTEQEMEEAGFAKARKLHKESEKPTKRCTDCGRKVTSPVTSFSKYGIDIMEPGEQLHESCARKRFSALETLLAELTT